MTKKRLHKKSIILRPHIIIGVIILATILWYSRPRPVAQPLDINLIGETSGTSTLTLSPGAISTTPGVESTLTLSLNTGGSHVTGAQIEIVYEPAKIGTPVVTLGSFLPNVFVNPKIENGRISFTVAAPPSSGGITGSGTIATIKIKPTVIGSSNLSFGDKNLIIATGSQANNLKLASDATLTITNPKPNKPTGLGSDCSSDGKKLTLHWNAVSGASSYKLRLDQKDGTNDKSIDNIWKTTYDLDIIPGQTYSWWVHTNKDGVDSDEARINNLFCAKPSPTPQPKADPPRADTPTPTAKPSKSPTATISPSTTPTPFITASPTTVGSDPSPTPTSKPGFFASIVLGWKSIFASLAEIFN